MTAISSAPCSCGSSSTATLTPGASSAARCDEALLDFDDAFRQARLATVYAIGEDGAARALDTRASRDVVQTYTLLFQITNFVVCCMDCMVLRAR